MLLNDGFNATQGNVALVGVTSDFRLEFQFIPKTPVSTSATYSETQTFGRDHKLMDYTGVNKTITLETYFTAQKVAFTDVLEKVLWLESLCRRTRDGAPPERVLFINGNLTQNIAYRVLSVNYDPKLWSADTFNPKQSSCTITLKEDPEFNVYAENYR